MDVNDEIAPARLFPAVGNFFESTENLPSDVDLGRIHRGEEGFEQHAFEGALGLLTKCLPEGYQAPNLSIILNISGDLRKQTYRRLLATLQTVVNVSTLHGPACGNLRVRRPALASTSHPRRVFSLSNGFSPISSGSGACSGRVSIAFPSTTENSPLQSSCRRSWMT